MPNPSSDRPHPSKPYHAATVILVRDDAREGLQVFLMRRRAAPNVFGGAWVFPGGRLDAEDEHPENETRCRGFQVEEVRGRFRDVEDPPGRLLGLHWAAVRETFEESGVLLAVNEDGAAVMNLGNGIPDRLAWGRKEVHQRSMTLLNLIKAEGWFLTLDRLAPYARWITPEAEPRRFDTRFFLARTPEGAKAVHDRVELTESVWLTPAEALARHRREDLPLLPPTFRTLEELSDHRTVDGLWAWTEKRTIRTIMPEVFMDGPRLGLRLPGHPDYSPAAGRRPASADEPTQILLDGTVWRSVWT